VTVAVDPYTISYDSARFPAVPDFLYLSDVRSLEELEILFCLSTRQAMMDASDTRPVLFDEPSH